MTPLQRSPRPSSIIILTGGKFNDYYLQHQINSEGEEQLIKYLPSPWIELYYNILMGGQQSAKRKEMIDILDSYTLERSGVVSEREFTTEIFKQLDNSSSHTRAGPILVSQMHVLKAFYDYLSQQVSDLLMQNRGVLKRSKLTESLEKIYDKPEKSIEYSYRIIVANRDKITKAEFTKFIETCLDKGVEAVLNLNSFDRVFQKSLRDWLSLNKPTIMQEIGEVFTRNTQSSQQFWTLGDFKRWILAKEHWTFYIEIKQKIYKIPLNIPCLFGVRMEKEQ